jgi:glycosyltransferase involved in cell wall biosynthesis
MNILMLTDLYPPIVGGGERHVQSLSTNLVHSGHQVTICTIGSPGLPGYEIEHGKPIYRIQGIFQRIPFLFKDTSRRWHPPVADPMVTNRLRQIIAESSPDIIHAHGRIVYSLLPLKDTLGIPLVVTLHSYWAICPNVNLMNRNRTCHNILTNDCVLCGRKSYGLAKSSFAYLGTRINKAALKSVDRFIAVSDFVRNVHLNCLKLSENKIVVIPNFYASEMQSMVKAGNELPKDFILFVGALNRIKGASVLIEAYQKLNTPTKLVLIGARHPESRYESTENISVMENAPYPFVVEAYRNCRFAVFPSIWPDPCPTVAFEAMSHKKAVIATKTGGFPDIVVDGETGILVPPCDAETLSQAIKYLLENPKIAEDMGHKSYERWKGYFTPEVVVPKVEKLYQSLLDRKG